MAPSEIKDGFTISRTWKDQNLKPIEPHGLSCKNFEVRRLLTNEGYGGVQECLIAEPQSVPSCLQVLQFQREDFIGRDGSLQVGGSGRDLKEKFCFSHVAHPENQRC